MSGSKSPACGVINSLFGVCSGPELRERVTSFLRRRYPVKAAENVAADMRLPVGTVQKWFSRENTPNGPAVVRLILVYGPALLASLTEDTPDWLDKAAYEEEQAFYDRQIEQLQAARAARR